VEPSTPYCNTRTHVSTPSVPYTDTHILILTHQDMEVIHTEYVYFTDV